MNKLTWLFLRFIRFISRPLIVSRAIEILHAVTWLWYAGLLLFRGYVNDPFTALTNNIPNWFVGFLFAAIGITALYGLYKNNIALRKAMLTIHGATIVYIVVFFFLTGVIPSITGYLIALFLVTLLVLWRMDITMS